MILGIDPGPVESGWCLIVAGVRYGGTSTMTVINAGKSENPWLRNFVCDWSSLRQLEAIVIENIQSYGGKIGRTVLDTCIEIGRFVQVCHDNQLPVILIPRPEYVRWHCDGARKINDSVLRQALLLKYGGDKKGEPLHLLKGGSDKRSAFAVAAYAVEAGKLTEGAQP